jgi:hypothetical protein
MKIKLTQCRKQCLTETKRGMETDMGSIVERKLFPKLFAGCLLFFSTIANAKICILSITGMASSDSPGVLANLHSLKTCDGEPRRALPPINNSGNMLEEQSGQLNELTRVEKVQFVQCTLTAQPMSFVGTTGVQRLPPLPVQQICFLSDQVGVDRSFQSNSDGPSAVNPGANDPASQKRPRQPSEIGGKM